jgi:hypothetical protein
MTYPAYPPLTSLTTAKVKEVMGAPKMTPADETWLTDCVNFVADYAGRMQAVNNLTDYAALWAAQLHAMRLYQRRGSSSGLQQFDIGVAMYVSRSDPDIAQAYRSRMPRVG